MSLHMVMEEIYLSDCKTIAEFTSANSRLVLQDLKSIVEPAICRTVSSSLWYSKGLRCSKGWNLIVEPLEGQCNW